MLLVAQTAICLIPFAGIGLSRGLVEIRLQRFKLHLSADVGLAEGGTEGGNELSGGLERQSIVDELLKHTIIRAGTERLRLS